MEPWRRWHPAASKKGADHRAPYVAPWVVAAHGATTWSADSGVSGHAPASRPSVGDNTDDGHCHESQENPEITHNPSPRESVFEGLRGPMHKMRQTLAAKHPSAGGARSRFKPEVAKLEDEGALALLLLPAPDCVQSYFAWNEKGSEGKHRILRWPRAARQRGQTDQPTLTNASHNNNYQPAWMPNVTSHMRPFPSAEQKRTKPWQIPSALLGKVR